MKLFCRVNFLWLFFMGLVFSHPVIATEKTMAQTKIETPLYFYHLKPPFVTHLESEQGLYFDLVELLNIDSRYHFKAVFVPRTRIERIIGDENFNSAVLGVNPIWFKDKDETKFFWTSSFYADRDHIISKETATFNYSSPEDLAGKTLAAARGQFYKILQPLFEQKQIFKFETVDELDVLDMVLLGRTDFGIVSASTFYYVLKRKPNLKQLVISTTPIDSFTRRILVSKSNEKLHAYLSEKLPSVLLTPQWQKIIAYYGR